MIGGGAFARARAMMAAIAAAAALPFAEKQAAMAALGAYESRGKRSKQPVPHDHGVARTKWAAAAKRRNVLRNRSNHRG